MDSKWMHVAKTGVSCMHGPASHMLQNLLTTEAHLHITIANQLPGPGCVSGWPTLTRFNSLARRNQPRQQMISWCDWWHDRPTNKATVSVRQREPRKSTPARIVNPSIFRPSSACGRAGSHRATTGDGQEHARKLPATSRATVLRQLLSSKRRIKETKNLFFLPFEKSFSSTCG